MAYPYGKYTNKTIAAAKASHVKMAFTYGTNTYATNLVTVLRQSCMVQLQKMCLLS